MALPLVSLIVPPSSSAAVLRRQLRAWEPSGLARLEVLWTAPPAVRDGATATEVDPWLWRALAPGAGDAWTAMNAALDASRGDYVWILEADAEYAPHALATLLRGARAEPDAVLWYGQARGVVPAGAEVLFGRAFNPALFAHDRLFRLQASLIHRRTIDAGCRFDARLGDVADHDFLQQTARHGRCCFLAGAAPLLRYTPRPSHAPAARQLREQCLRHARWTGTRLYHTLRSSLLCQRAAERLARGDAAAARAAFEAVLTEYPDDPDALHGLARCELAADAAAAALPLLQRAQELDPGNSAYRDTTARARALLAETAAVPADPPRPDPGARAAAAEGRHLPLAPSRLAACPCGSGRRYKDCCGDLRATATAAQGGDAQTRIARARAQLRRGEGSAAAATLAGLPAPADLRPALAREAGALWLELHRLDAAEALLAAALDRAPQDEQARATYEHCCHQLLRRETWSSAASVLREQLAHLALRAAGRERPRSTELHVVVPLHRLGGSERRALNLCRSLGKEARVTLWSTTPPLAVHQAEHPVRVIEAGRHPAGGTLVLIGTYFECGAWLEQAPFERVVVCHNLAEQYPGLIERLIQLECNPHAPGVRLCFPSGLFRAACGLAGFVDYSPVDLDVFQPAARPGASAQTLRVGRHGRAYALKFHPDDGAFFRAVQRRGHRVHLLGGSILAGAFAAGESAPELLDEGAMAPAEFLRNLDVFVYRKHPAFFETGGSVVLEAMACALPVIAFAEDCGAAELIEHGRNGYRVDSEEQALQLLDRLAQDPDLRRRIGAAARADLAALQARQAQQRADWYLGDGEPQ